MIHLGDFKTINSTPIDFFFNTRALDGTPMTLSGSPAMVVYANNNTTEKTSAVAIVVDFDGIVGLNQVRIDTADSIFFQAGSSYTVVMKTGTVNGTSVAGTVIAMFGIEITAASTYSKNIYDNVVVDNPIWSMYYQIGDTYTSDTVAYNAALAAASADSAMGNTIAIMAKTDNLPAVPAAKYDQMSLMTSAISATTFTADAITRLTSGVAPASTALSSAIWTATKANYLDAAVTSRLATGTTVVLSAGTHTGAIIPSVTNVTSSVGVVNSVATNAIAASSITTDAITKITSGVAPASTALSTATWTPTKAGYLDASISSRMASGPVTLADGHGLALSGDASAIRTQTDKLRFVENNVISTVSSSSVSEIAAAVGSIIPHQEPMDPVLLSDVASIKTTVEGIHYYDIPDVRGFVADTYYYSIPDLASQVSAVDSHVNSGTTELSVLNAREYETRLSVEAVSAIVRVTSGDVKNLLGRLGKVDDYADGYGGPTVAGAIEELLDRPAVTINTTGIADGVWRHANRQLTSTITDEPNPKDMSAELTIMVNGTSSGSISNPEQAQAFSAPDESQDTDPFRVGS